ncbi:hypothetical protein QBC47DRAFT_375901 [Echria macrotheca]|uniref:Uncharacterized protein n=1 Tax=Echria macrotheca TaxID=438768 RepID=A0AAJ0BFM7_9PEZI|nr:hypothetical protein QBC47DRAFT_375901 [Echria macrotheca]
MTPLSASSPSSLPPTPVLTPKTTATEPRTSRQPRQPSASHGTGSATQTPTVPPSATGAPAVIGLLRALGKLLRNTGNDTALMRLGATIAIASAVATAVVVMLLALFSLLIVAGLWDRMLPLSILLGMGILLASAGTVTAAGILVITAMVYPALGLLGIRVCFPAAAAGRGFRAAVNGTTLVTLLGTTTVLLGVCPLAAALMIPCLVYCLLVLFRVVVGLLKVVLIVVFMVITAMMLWATTEPLRARTITLLRDMVNQARLRWDTARDRLTMTTAMTVMKAALARMVAMVIPPTSTAVTVKVVIRMPTVGILAGETVSPKVTALTESSVTRNENLTISTTVSLNGTARRTTVTITVKDNTRTRSGSNLVSKTVTKPTDTPPTHPPSTT